MKAGAVQRSRPVEQGAELDELCRANGCVDDLPMQPRWYCEGCERDGCRMLRQRREAEAADRGPADGAPEERVSAARAADSGRRTAGLTRERFEAIAAELDERADAVMWRKNQDYRTDEDVLGNIREQAREAGLEPIEVALVFFSKHRRALTRGLRGEELRSEPLEERFADALNLLRILWVLWSADRGPADGGPEDGPGTGVPGSVAGVPDSGATGDGRREASR